MKKENICAPALAFVFAWHRIGAIAAYENNDDIPSSDTTEIKHLINRVKQGELDQGDALLIEKLLNILPTIVSLLERKHTSIQRMKEVLFGMKEKKQGKDEDKNRAEDGRPGAGGSSQTDSPNETASNSTCEGDSSIQEVRRRTRLARNAFQRAEWLMVSLNATISRPDGIFGMDRRLEMLRALLDRGAEPNLVAEGHTPRSLAEGRGNGEIVAILNRYISAAS